MLCGQGWRVVWARKSQTAEVAKPDKKKQNCKAQLLIYMDITISRHKVRLPKFSKRPFSFSIQVKPHDNYSGPPPMFHATHAI